MNVGYIKLSDGTIAVTDENGNIKKINDEISTEELLIENKIETINKNIGENKMKVENCKSLTLLAKHMLICQPILFVCCTFFGFCIDISFGLMALTSSILICGAATIMWGIAHIVEKKKLKAFEAKLEKAKELKLEYENELSKKKVLETQKEEFTINKPISLTQQNEIEISLINEQLNVAYSDATHQKTKKLVLENKSNKKY